MRTIPRHIRMNPYERKEARKQARIEIDQALEEMVDEVELFCPHSQRLALFKYYTQWDNLTLYNCINNHPERGHDNERCRQQHCYGSTFSYNTLLKATAGQW